MCVYVCFSVLQAHYRLTLQPRLLSVPVTQPVHHCPPTKKSRTISPSASHLPPTPFLFIQGFCPFLLWRSTILHLPHLIAAPFFPPSHHPTSAPVSRPTNWYAGPYFLKIFFFRLFPHPPSTSISAYLHLSPTWDLD